MITPYIYLEKDDFIFVWERLKLGNFLNKLDNELHSENAVDQHFLIIFRLFFTKVQFFSELVLNGKQSDVNKFLYYITILL